MFDTQMLIGESFVVGSEAGERMLNPRTEETLIDLPEASLQQVDAAVDAAERAFATWSATTPGERSALLLKLADAIERDGEAFASLEALNCGKPRIRVLTDEIPAIVDCFRFFAGAVRTMHGAAAGEYIAGHTSMVRRDPIGVVGSIAPWNYPLMMAAWKLAPALAGGNAVVLKPSEQTPLTTLKLARLVAEIFPAGVVNVVVGRGETVGNALINHPKVAMVSLTGDVATGKKVLTAAAKTVKRTHLELGGKAPVIVFDDADLAAVVEGVKVFGYYNAGQDCTAACRVYAGKKIYDKLVADLAGAVQTLKFNEADDDLNDIGPLISARQRSRVSSFVERALEAKHISIAAGGIRPPGPGFFYEPTVVAGASAVRRDRAARSLRASRVGDSLRRRRSGRRLGERFGLRARLFRLDTRRLEGDADRGAPPVRLHLGQLSLHAGERDAARGSEVVRLRQGFVDVRARGLHGRPPRDGQDGLSYPGIRYAGHTCACNRLVDCCLRPRCNATRLGLDPGGLEELELNGRDRFSVELR